MVSSAPASGDLFSAMDWATSRSADRTAWTRARSRCHQRVVARHLGAHAVGALDVDDAPIDEPGERVVERRQLVDGETIFGVIGVQEVEGVLQVDVMGVTPVNGIGWCVVFIEITTLYH